MALHSENQNPPLRVERAVQGDLFTAVDGAERAVPARTTLFALLGEARRPKFVQCWRNSAGVQRSHGRVGRHPEVKMM